MFENVIKKLFPIRDEKGRSCTFPTFASQVFGDDGEKRALWQADKGFYADNAENAEKLGGKEPSAYVQTANVLDTLEEVTANTADGMVAGAGAVKKLYQVAKTTDITLQYAGNASNTSMVRKWGRLVHVQINIGISKYPEQGDNWYKIGKIPAGYYPSGVVKTLGALEIWSVPRSLASVSINAAGEIEAIVSDVSNPIIAEQGPAIVANLYYFV